MCCMVTLYRKWNHIVKRYWNCLVALCREHFQYHGRHGLSKARMKKITHGAHCAINMHSTTGDVVALCHNLRNNVWHYFGDHTKSNSIHCKNTNTDTSNHYIIKYVWVSNCICTDLSIGACKMDGGSSTTEYNQVLSNTDPWSVLWV